MQIKMQKIFTCFLTKTKLQKLTFLWNTWANTNFLFHWCACDRMVIQTMAATKRNAGLTSAVPRATLNDEELVCIFCSKRGWCIWVKYCVVDNARRNKRKTTACVLTSTCANRNCFPINSINEFNQDKQTNNNKNENFI